MKHRALSSYIVGVFLSFFSVCFFAAPPSQADDMSAVEAGSDDRLEEIFAGAAPTSVDDLRAMQSRVQELSSEVAAYTVGVQIGPAQGSGVIISGDGYVLTAAHVGGAPGRDARFILPSGRTVRGKTLGVNRTLDAGLMKITEKDEDGETIKWPHAELGESESLEPGQWVLATGHPNGFQKGRSPVVRLGRVLANRDKVIMTDCTLVGGDSGGPLFDLDGKVVGIHSRISGPITVNLHAPIDAYRDDWDRLVAGEQWGHLPGETPFIGVRGSRDATNAELAEVYEGGPAAEAGLRKGDVVLRFDGEEVEDFPDLARLVSRQQPGEEVVLEVRRGDETLELDLTIGRRE